MDVIFATNHDFCPYTAVAIVSLLENNKGEQINVHLFTIGVDHPQIEQMLQLVSAYKDVKLQVYPVDESLLKGFPHPGVYSWAAYLRLFAASLLPSLEKALYLDVDMVIIGSLKELWDMDISHYSCAAVYDSILSYNMTKDFLGYDYYREGYANSGMLLLNLAYWREHQVELHISEYLKNHPVRLCDQDVLNIILHSTIKFIHPKWNCHTGYFAFPPLVRDDQKKYIKSLWRGAKIAHFTGPAKPWYKECVNPYKKSFKRFMQLTSWKDSQELVLQPNFWKRWTIITLRYGKNLVALFFSIFYK